jgi:hypothetical protein
MSIGTAEYIRFYIYRDCPAYSFPPCVYGHNACSCTDEAGGPCINEAEADNDQSVNVFEASRIIDSVYVKNNDNYELLIIDDEN